MGVVLNKFSFLAEIFKDKDLSLNQVGIFFLSKGHGLSFEGVRVNEVSS